MALKTTQRQLKKKYKEEIKALKWAIYGKCHDCLGFRIDSAAICSSPCCPLYKYRLGHSAGRNPGPLALFLRSVRHKIERIGY